MYVKCGVSIDFKSLNLSCLDIRLPLVDWFEFVDPKVTKSRLYMYLKQKGFTPGSKDI